MRSSMRRKLQARKALSMLLVNSFSCLFSKVTLLILIGVGACWGTLHSSFETNECRGFLPCYQKGSWVKQTPSLDEHGA